MLFNGFKPLFQALSPHDINQLSYEIVQVFQGEGGTLEGLLAHTASVTKTLADRDQLIGELIDNLNAALTTIGDRDKQLSALIVTSDVRRAASRRQGRDPRLPRLDLRPVGRDRRPGQGHPQAVRQRHQDLRGVAGNLAKNRREIDRALQVLPIKLEKVGRTAIYGSWFNFYLCEFKGKVTLPGRHRSPSPQTYNTNSERCRSPMSIPSASATP